MRIRPLPIRAVVVNYFAAVNRFVTPSEFAYGAVRGGNVYVLWSGCLAPMEYTVNEFLLMVANEVSGASE